MVKVPFACSECHLILDTDENPDQCPRCPSAPVTTDWQGYVVILEPVRSEIAQKLNIERPGNYALKVNLR